jgi:hypothetical protein
MQKKWILGLGAVVLAFSSLFGIVACDDNNDSSTRATDTPSAGTTPSDTTPAADTTATTEATP